ncbi:hypothetical protein T492DRAFT_851193 [Pavlovales sp. CCMP2436]|nr:hypothetical protein T492DRAFT_851193 [Pavlovales sp. CCMP2436]
MQGGQQMPVGQMQQPQWQPGQVAPHGLQHQHSWPVPQDASQLQQQQAQLAPSQTWPDMQQHAHVQQVVQQAMSQQLMPPPPQQQMQQMPLGFLPLQQMQPPPQQPPQPVQYAMPYALQPGVEYAQYPPDMQLAHAQQAVQQVQQTTSQPLMPTCSSSQVVGAQVIPVSASLPVFASLVPEQTASFKGRTKSMPE